MHGVKIRCIWITHIKEHQSQWVCAAVVVAGHFHVRRHRHRLTSFHRDRLAPLDFQRECTFQHINSYRKTVCMEQRLIARLEIRRENADLLLFPPSASLEQSRSGVIVALRHPVLAPSLSNRRAKLRTRDRSSSTCSSVVPSRTQ
jgi:hypothetical protein